MKNFIRRHWRSLRCLIGSHEWEGVYGCMVVRCPHCDATWINR